MREIKCRAENLILNVILLSTLMKMTAKLVLPGKSRLPHVDKIYFSGFISELRYLFEILGTNKYFGTFVVYDKKECMKNIKLLKLYIKQDMTDSKFS